MSETETVPTDATTGLPLDDVRIKNINYGPFIDSGSDEKNIREATGLTGEGREPKPYEWSGSGLHESGPSESAHAQMRRAANMMGNKRREDFADELQARSGIDADTAAAVTDHITDGPPPAVRATRTDGTYLPELRDDVPVLDQLENGNDIPRSQLKLAGRNFRDAQAAEAQQLLWELGQRREQEAASAQAIEQAASQPAPQPAPQPQPDPVAIERAQLAQERQAVEQFRRLSVDEAAHAIEINRGVEFYRAQQFPPLNDQAAINHMAAYDPQRFQLFRDTVEALQAHQTQLSVLQAQKAPYVQRQEAQMQAARTAQFDAFDKQFNTWLDKAAPNFSKGARRNELTAAVKSYLRDDLGLSDREIEHHYKQTGLLRSPAAQKMVANAAMWKMAQANAKNIANKRAPIPPVQQPGTYRPAGADQEDTIRSLQQQLETASGQKALRIATQLTQVLRAR